MGAAGLLRALLRGVVGVAMAMYWCTGTDARRDKIHTRYCIVFAAPSLPPRVFFLMDFQFSSQHSFCFGVPRLSERVRPVQKSWTYIYVRVVNDTNEGLSTDVQFMQ